LGSSRFPRKILEPYKGETLLSYIINECEDTKIPVVTAIPKSESYGEDFEIPSLGYKIFFNGSENDVISRFYHCAKIMDFDPIIRVCADTPLIKHELILQQLENYKKYGGFCYGNFCEVFSFEELEKYYKNDRRPEVREHVTYGMLHDRAINWEIDLDN